MSTFPISKRFILTASIRNCGLQCLMTCVVVSLSLCGFAGCAAFHPVRGVPAVYVPEDYLGEEAAVGEKRSTSACWSAISPTSIVLKPATCWRSLFRASSARSITPTPHRVRTHRSAIRWVSINSPRLVIPFLCRTTRQSRCPISHQSICMD